MAEALLVYESLNGEEVDWLIAGKDLDVLREQRRIAAAERAQEAKARAEAKELAPDAAIAAVLALGLNTEAL